MCPLPRCVCVHIICKGGMWNPIWVDEGAAGTVGFFWRITSRLPFGGWTILAASQTHSPLIHFLFCCCCFADIQHLFIIFDCLVSLPSLKVEALFLLPGKGSEVKNLCLMIKILDLFPEVFSIHKHSRKKKKGSNIRTYQVFFSSVWKVSPRIFGTSTYYCTVAHSTSFKSIHSNH